MSNKNLILSTYRDIIDLIKNGVVTDINSAFTQGTLEIEDHTKEQLLSLIDTIIGTYAANGYEQMSRVIDVKPTRKKR